MALVALQGRFGRFFPLWVRCAVVGLALSWMIAIGHWLLVETGQLPRIRTHMVVDADSSGQAIVEAIHCRITGLWPNEAPFLVDGYTTIAYGWPIANWGTVFRQRSTAFWQSGVDPVVAVDMRWLWPPGNLPDPYHPTLTLAARNAQCAAGGPCPRTLCFDAYQRYMPIFPLVGHSMLASVFYGLPFFAWYKWREVRRRRGHCASCGYDRSTLPPLGPCPECGMSIRR